MSIGERNSAQTSHILGVDFGKAKIGLAIADEETKMAFAFDIFKNDKDFLEKLREIIESKDIQTVVIGMTRHEKDEESAKEKQMFAQLLRDELNVEVYFQEEMFTTVMAHNNIKMRGGKNIAKFDDKEAARIILQEWLDNKS